MPIKSGILLKNHEIYIPILFELLTKQSSFDVFSVDNILLNR